MGLLNRRLAKLALVGSAVLGSLLANSLAVLALPMEQILEKLNIVPVFTLGNDKGDIFLAEGQNDQKIAVLFMSQQDAQNSAEQVQKNNPNEKIQVLPLPLGQFYKLVKEKQGQADTPVIDLVPVKQQVEQAQNLLREQNAQAQAQEFQGVPLFFLTAQRDGQEVYLPLQSQGSSEAVIPLFFEKETAQKVMEQLKQQQPDEATNISIRVVPLEGVLAQFEKSEDESLKRMVLVPSQESSTFIQQVRQQQQNQQSTPANSPANNNAQPSQPQQSQPQQ
jgi:Tic22-like family